MNRSHLSFTVPNWRSMCVMTAVKRPSYTPARILSLKFFMFLQNVRAENPFFWLDCHLKRFHLYLRKEQLIALYNILHRSCSSKCIQTCELQIFYLMSNCIVNNCRVWICLATESMYWHFLTAELCPLAAVMRINLTTFAPTWPSENFNISHWEQRSSNLWQQRSREEIHQLI